MRTIGLIGGMSWESSAEYYRIINQEVARRLGGLHSAPCLLYSLDFHEVEALQQAGSWEQAGELLAGAARGLQRGGADLLLICTNTMHKVAESVAAAVEIPLLHIADATAAAVRARELRRVALLGTRYTMEQDFYRGRLAEQHGLEVLVPEEPAREMVHRVIYQELCRGELREDSRARYRALIVELVGAGAQAVILGCTEIGLLVGAEDSPVPLFDTTRLHALAAVDLALGEAA